MKIGRTVLVIGLILGLYVTMGWAGVTPLELSEETAEEPARIRGTEWLKKFNESRDSFAQKYGTRFGFVLNYVQQVILRNNRDVGNSRSLWYWNLEVSQELWQGAEVFTEFEVDKNKGIDKFIPTYSYFDSDSGKNAGLYVPELYLEQHLTRDKIIIAAGKLDLSDWFDLNEVASSSDVQFLSSPLINNYTIPFPCKGMGAMVKFQPYEWLYFQSGASTAKAVSTKVGFSDAFNSTLFINEFGFSPKLGKLPGNYRFIFHLLHRKLGVIMDDLQEERNHFGFGLSFDQAVTERISLFVRYGSIDQKVNEVAHAWSAGGQIVEPIPGRKYDCFGVGVAQNILGRDFRAYSDPEFTATRETMLETYYSFSVNEFLTLTCDLQVVLEPYADRTVANPIAGSIRMLIAF